MVIITFMAHSGVRSIDMSRQSNRSLFFCFFKKMFINPMFKCIIKHDLYASIMLVQWNLDLRKPDLRQNLDLRKIVGTTDFLVHKLFDLRKIF